MMDLAPSAFQKVKLLNVLIARVYGHWLIQVKILYGGKLLLQSSLWPLLEVSPLGTWLLESHTVGLDLVYLKELPYR